MREAIEIKFILNNRLDYKKDRLNPYKKVTKQKKYMEEV